MYQDNTVSFVNELEYCYTYMYMYLKELWSQLSIDLGILKVGVTLIPEVQPGLLITPVTWFADLSEIMFSL